MIHSEADAVMLLWVGEQTVDCVPAAKVETEAVFADVVEVVEGKMRFYYVMMWEKREEIGFLEVIVLNIQGRTF